MTEKKTLSGPNKQEARAQLKSKVKFLTDGNTLDHNLNDVAKSVGLDAANLSGYMENKAAKRGKLLTILADLEKAYGDDLKNWKAPAPDDFSHEQVPLSEVKSDTQYSTSGIQFQALKELVFSYISKSNGVSIDTLDGELLEKIAEIEKRLAP